MVVDPMSWVWNVLKVELFLSHWVVSTFDRATGCQSVSYNLISSWLWCQYGILQSLCMCGGTTDIHQRSLNLRHLYPNVGLNLGVLGFGISGIYVGGSLLLYRCEIRFMWFRRTSTKMTLASLPTLNCADQSHLLNVCTVYVTVIQ